MGMPDSMVTMPDKLTDMLDADSQLLTAQDQVDANRADAARAAVGVFRSLGGGWDPEDRVISHDGASSASAKAS